MAAPSARPTLPIGARNDTPLTTSSAGHAQRGRQLSDLMGGVRGGVIEEATFGEKLCDPADAGHLARVGDPLRLDAVRASGVLGDVDSAPFDALAGRVARRLDVPVGLVTIVTDDEQVFPGQAGLGEPHATSRRTSLSCSFCQFAVSQDDLVVIEDATSDALAPNGAVEELGVLAYLGAPIRDAAGQVLGAVCAIDAKPRPWSATDRETVQAFADEVSATIAAIGGDAATPTDPAETSAPSSPDVDTRLDRLRDLAARLPDEELRRLVSLAERAIERRAKP